MNIDLHPIIVHTPIAFLAIYAALELLTVFKRLRFSKTFFVLKAFLLTVGFFGSIAATISGENALELHREFLNAEIAHLHEEYGEMTRNVFGLLFVAYLTMAATLYGQYMTSFSSKFPRVQNMIVRVGEFFKKYYGLAILLGILGLGLVSITGALGGALVYGTESKDPFIGLTVDLVCGAKCE